ncbi:unnamed protein product [Blepharisma stoltei]|uniref:Uncharacterized protein n=1 Tax=Blepharisma stoltei TaxID=1481888 RepID=A0AAU9J4V4_9CILI|nr:unnamed protein product [Blepharisma stoltei]
MKKYPLKILVEKQNDHCNKLFDQLNNLMNEIDDRRIQLRQLDLNIRSLSVNLFQANLEIGNLTNDLESVNQNTVYEKEKLSNLTHQCQAAKLHIKNLKENYNQAIGEVENNEKILAEAQETLRNIKSKHSILRSNSISELSELEENSERIKKKLLDNKFSGNNKDLAMDIYDLIKRKIKEAIKPKNNLEKKIEQIEEKIIEKEHKIIEDRIDYTDKISRAQELIRERKDFSKKCGMDWNEVLEKKKMFKLKLKEEIEQKIKTIQASIQKYKAEPELFDILKKKRENLASELELLYIKIEEEKKVRVNITNKRKKLKRDIEDIEIQIGTARMNLYVGNHFKRL